ncbi:MAG: NADH-quinone oxidoreductase subunit NuoE [Elusimicrobiales bacterium]
MNNLIEKIESIIKKYPTKESAILEILHIIQKEKNYITEDDINWLSEMFGINYSRIKAVATFYTMYNLKKTGKYHIQICRNISCHISGYRKIKEYIEKKLNIKEGEVSLDGMWSLVCVECLGSCGTAPVMMINQTYYEKLTEEKIDNIIEEILRKNKGI